MPNAEPKGDGEQDKKKICLDGLPENLKSVLVTLHDIASDLRSDLDDLKTGKVKVADIESLQTKQAAVEAKVDEFTQKYEQARAAMDVAGAKDLVNGKAGDKFLFSRMLLGIRDHGKNYDAWPKGPEAEVCKQLDRQIRDDPEMARSMGTTPDSAGGEWVPRTVLHDRLIPSVRASSVLLASGVTQLPGLIGEVDIPRVVADTTGYMIGERDAPTESEMTLGHLTLRQHDIGGLMIMSNRLMEQSVVAADNVGRMNLARTLGLKLDQQGLTGDGADKNMLGIINETGVITTPFTTTTTDDLIYDYLIDVHEAMNLVDLGEESEDVAAYKPGWIAHPRFGKMIRKLRSGDTTGEHMQLPARILTEKPERFIFGDPHRRTTQLPVASNLTTIIFGNWAEYYLGLFQTLRIDVSKEYRFTQRETAFLATLGADWGTAHAASFSLGTIVPV